MVNQVLLYIFAAAAVLLIGVGYAKRARRTPLWAGALIAGAAGFAAYSDAFWPMVVLGALAISCAFSATRLVDMSWRVRFSLVMSLGLVAFISLWPSLASITQPPWRDKPYLPCPTYVKDRVDFRLVAGLDLRGGLRLVYTVEVGEAIADKRDRYFEDMRVELAKIFELHSGDERPSEDAYRKLRDKVELRKSKTEINRIDLEMKEGADGSKIDARFRSQFAGDLAMSNPEPGKWTFRIKDSVESGIRERAVAQAKDIILRRVDEMGLREASVSTRDEDIIVEVPGSDEKQFDEIRDIISKTARLEFKLLDDDSNFFTDLRKTATPESLPEGFEWKRESVSVGLDDEGDIKTKANWYPYLKIGKEETSQQALERFKSWVATIDVPDDREVGYELVYEDDPKTLEQTEHGWRGYYLKGRADITGDMIRDAQAVPDQSQGSLGGWYVAVTFTDQGGNIFDRVTAANIKRRFAIILDGKTVSAPVIQTRIAGGNASITMGSGDPSIQLRDSRQLELVLRSGALPAPISPSNEQRIGPSLGRDAIKLGIEGGIGGGFLVLLFMILYYRRAGIVADIAVSMNLFLQLAILASFSASMTLPGIAGLALTVGMSVDSNVLINERIKEELRAGKSARAAVEVGYNKALSAIVDGHLTTLISGVVLAQYGTGPIKGFAVTLIVGVITSIFCGIVVTRVLFDLWVRGFGRSDKLSMG